MAKKITWLAGPVALLLISSVNAGDLSSDIRKGADGPHAGNGNYIELGLSLGALQSPLYGLPRDSTPGETFYAGSLDLNLHLQYKGWFMEGFSQSLEQFTFGYNFAESDRWSLDTVVLEQHGEISASESKYLKGIKTRDSDFMMGLRATGYYANYILQAHVLTDTSDTHSGQVFSIKLARRWQYKNWNFHVIQSESYRTHKVVDYYLSVQAEDATEKFNEFHAQAGFTHTFEIGATYPLSQKWVFRTLFRHIQMDSQWRNSPLLESTHGNLFTNSISYVF